MYIPPASPVLYAPKLEAKAALQRILYYIYCTILCTISGAIFTTGTSTCIPYEAFVSILFCTQRMGLAVGNPRLRKKQRAPTRPLLLRI